MGGDCAASTRAIFAAKRLSVDELDLLDAGALRAHAHKVGARQCLTFPTLL